MQKYTNFVISSVGTPLSGALIYVYNTGTTTPSTIYSTNAGASQTNPITTDTQGKFAFYAADGRYDLSVVYNGSTVASITDVLLEDPATGPTTVIVGGSVDDSPIGATTPSTGAFTTLDATGNLNLSGTGARITGDFSNATPNSRVSFQSSTTNGATVIQLFPNGTSNTSALLASNSSNTSNYNYGALIATASEVQLQATYFGTGTYLPMTFYTGGSERMRIGTDGVISGATVNAINGGQLAGLRNRIINGDMRIAQRGTSFAAIANGAYFNDRFLWGNSTAAVVTAGQGVGPGSPFFASGFAQVTTADASISAGDLARIVHRIEGFNIRDLFGTTFTLSFRVASAKTGTHCVSFTNSAGDRSYVAEYTVNAANTWETKTITVTGGLTTAGTWNTTTGNGLEVTWTLAAGSTYQATAGSWQTGYFAATANQVNCLDTIGNTFAITGVQLEVGSTATPFEQRPYGLELALCQRYLPAFNSTSTSDYVCNGFVVSATQAYFLFPFVVEPRVPPTGASVSSSTHFASNQVGGTGTNCNPTFSSASRKVCRLVATISGGTAGQAAELYASSASGQILFTGCEL